MEFSKQASFFLKAKSHTVEVRCWEWSSGEWAWNVYGYVFDNHVLFNDPQRLIDNAPLSGGCTFDQAKIVQPIGGCRFDFQRTSKSYCVGSDYKHSWDADYSKNGPDDMPAKVERDAKELFQWLSEVE